MIAGSFLSLKPRVRITTAHSFKHFHLRAHMFVCFGNQSAAVGLADAVYSEDLIKCLINLRHFTMYKRMISYKLENCDFVHRVLACDYDLY